MQVDNIHTYMYIHNYRYVTVVEYSFPCSEIKDIKNELSAYYRDIKL